MCGCQKENIANQAAPHRKSLDFKVTSNPPEGCAKACTGGTLGNQILVDAKYWAKWSRVQQDAALAHEVAHRAGAGCETCADYVAGSIMRQWGYSQSMTRSAIASVIRTRPMAGQHAAQGWDANKSTHGNMSLDALDVFGNDERARVSAEAQAAAKKRADAFLPRQAPTPSTLVPGTRFGGAASHPETGHVPVPTDKKDGSPPAAPVEVIKEESFGKQLALLIAAGLVVAWFTSSTSVA